MGKVTNKSKELKVKAKKLKLELIASDGCVFSRDLIGSHVHYNPRKEVFVCKCEICDMDFLSANKNDYICYLCKCDTMNAVPTPVKEINSGIKVKDYSDISWSIIRRGD